MDWTVSPGGSAGAALRWLRSGFLRQLFTPGVDRSYEAATTASVTSTAGDAALSVSPQPASPTNGASTLSEPLQARSRRRSGPGRCPATR